MTISPEKLKEAGQLAHDLINKTIKIRSVPEYTLQASMLIDDLCAEVERLQQAEAKLAKVKNIVHAWCHGETYRTNGAAMMDIAQELNEEALGDG